MKFIGLLFLAYFASGSVVLEEKQYTTKYDNIDIDNVIENERLLKNYVDCLLEQGSCTPDGFELRNNMPDAIQTNCSKCSAKQKEGSDKLIKYLIENKPEYWDPIQAKYDPLGNYTTRYLESNGVASTGKENTMLSERE